MVGIRALLMLYFRDDVARHGNTPEIELERERGGPSV